MRTPGGLGTASKPVDESWDMWVNQARGAPADQQLSLDTQQLGTQQLGVVNKGALGLHTAQLAGKERTVNILSLGQIQSSLFKRFGDHPGRLIYDQLFAAKKTDHQPIYAADIRFADAIGRTLEKCYQLLANESAIDIDDAQAKIVAIFSDLQTQETSQLLPDGIDRLANIVQAYKGIGPSEDAQTYTEQVKNLLVTDVKRVKQVPLESKPSAHGDVAQVLLELTASPKVYRPRLPSNWQDWVAIKDLGKAVLPLKDVSNEQAHAVAQLCLEHASTDPRSVSAILHFNENVRKAVITHLLANTHLGVKIEPQQQEDLALCYLEAGCSLDKDLPGGEQYTLGIQKLIDRRCKAQDTYWQEHAAKHEQDSFPPKFAVKFAFQKDQAFFYSVRQGPSGPPGSSEPLSSPSDYSFENINGKVSSSHDSNKIFACRHLQEAAKRILTEPRKGLMHAMGSRELTSFNWQELEDAFNKQMRSGMTIAFSPEHFGDLMCGMALGMKEGDKRAFTISWNADPAGHAMCVIVEKTKARTGEGVKQKSTEQSTEQTEEQSTEQTKAQNDDGHTQDPREISCIKVSLYEPNVSANISHLKVFPEQLATLGFKNFDKRNIRRHNKDGVFSLHVDHQELATQCAGKYTKEDRASQIASLGQAISHNNSAEIEKVLERLRSMPAATSPLNPQEERWLIDGLGRAIQDGCTDTVKAFLGALPELKSKGLLTEDQIFTIAEAKDIDGTPGLFMALQNGRADTVKAFLGALPNLGLDPKQIFRIVEAKKQNGVPGLYMALQEGRTDTVKAFLEALSELKEFKLTADQIKDILEAKNQNGVPGLNWALEKGHTQAVKTFLEALPKLGLTADQIKDILEAKDNDDTPGLYMALQEGRTDTVRVFLEALSELKEFKLTADQIKDILEAKDNDDTPGLYMALQEGRTDTVRVFLEALPGLKEFKLTADQIKDILEAKDNDDTPGLYMALQDGHTDTVKAFLEALPGLKEFELTADQIKDILEAKDNDGTPGLLMALKDGRTDAAIAFLDALPKFESLQLLTSDEIRWIAQAKWQGTPGLYWANKNGHIDTEREYLAALARLNRTLA